MNRKAKGTAGERELLKLFWENGWAAIRAPGSGSAKHPSPDIIAGNILRRIVLECKVCAANSKYLEKHEIEQLKTFATAFGAEAWIGVKFSKNGWFFLSLDDLTETDKSFVVKLEDARAKGLIFEELIGNF